jgi:hypothetical protein
MGYYRLLILTADQDTNGFDRGGGVAAVYQGQKAVPSGHFAGAKLGRTMGRGGGASRCKMERRRQGSLPDGPTGWVRFFENCWWRPSSVL